MTVWYRGLMAEWAELVRLVKPISSGEARLRGCCWYRESCTRWRKRLGDLTNSFYGLAKKNTGHNIISFILDQNTIR